MIDIDVTTDNRTGLVGMITGLSSQLPFAYSLGLNKLVNKVQGIEQEGLAGKFTLRRAEFIQHTIYRQPGRDFATKNNLVATVRVDPKRNFLAKFEDGGTKESTSGHALAVPIFRDADHSIVIKRGDPLSVRRLFESIQSRKGHVFKGRKKKGERVPINYGRVFLVKNERGTFILERVRPGDDGNRVLYWFRKSVPIPAVLQFEEIGLRAVLEHSDAMFDEALEQAMSTAK